MEVQAYIKVQVFTLKLQTQSFIKTKQRHVIIT